MSIALEDDSDPTLTHFAHRTEFLGLLNQFLAVDIASEPDAKQDAEEEGWVQGMGAILDQYLPLPGLLDPHLDQIVPPLMDVLSVQLMRLAQAESRSDGSISSARLYRLGRVINWTIKVRGWKAIIPQFPSAISHLPTLVNLLSPHVSGPNADERYLAHHPLLSGQAAWELRAVLLLWLALLLTAPFSLSALGDPEFLPASAFAIGLSGKSRLFSVQLPQMAERCILAAIPLLRSSGKEGAYAGLVLARIYARSDASVGLQSFLDWLAIELAEGERESEANFVASVLEMLAVLPQLVLPSYMDTIRRFTTEVMLPHLQGGRTASTSGLVRKLAVKAVGRWWTAKLAYQAEQVEEPPEGLEEVLDDLMSGLGDRDTIVRYSSAKYLARIASALPEDFSAQIVSAVIGLFRGTEQEPVVLSSFDTVVDPGGTTSSGGAMGLGGNDAARGEARWHGVCLAVAEMARRGLVQDDATEEAVQWAIKGLTFDLRRGAHSVGSNVRDAAAYVLWSLSRASSREALASYAQDMATSMVCVACFDREVGVRRAASAAFQEGVGRLGLYPEGIDVLGKTDFYSVSVRRMAFTAAAPAVAMHPVYRDRMRAHLHHITLRHWDGAMRVLGASALKDILALGDDTALLESVNIEIAQLPSLESANVHGALAALERTASSLGADDAARVMIFDALASIRPAALISSISADILQTACDVITAVVSEAILRLDSAHAIVDRIIEMSMKRKEEVCHEAVARLFGRLSELRDNSGDVKRLVTNLKGLRASQKQAAALALGSIKYARVSASSTVAILALLDQLFPKTGTDVETRRNAIRSLGSIAKQEQDNGQPLVRSEDFLAILDALIDALADYTTDQRGDVGSWIRKAALVELGNLIAHQAKSQHASQEEKLARLPQASFDWILSGTYRLAVDKLEPVRAAAAYALTTMRDARANTVWQWEGVEHLRLSLPEGLESFRRCDQQEWFSTLMPLLDTRWRPALISGLALTIGSQIGTLSDLAFVPFEGHLSSSPRTSRLLGKVLGDLDTIMLEDQSSNRICIPALQTLHRIFASSIGRSADPAEIEEPILAILITACKNLNQIKSIDRISGVMKLVILLLSVSSNMRQVRAKCIEVLPQLLDHRFPRVRSLAAESLYLAVEGAERTDETESAAEELEGLLLETDWTQKEDAESEREGRVAAVLRLSREVFAI